MGYGAALLSGICGNHMVMAQGTLHEDPEMGAPNLVRQKEAVDFYELVKGYFVTSTRPTPALFTEIRGVVKPNEFPKNISVVKSSGNAQFDANCLEAVLGSERADASPLTLYGQWFFSSQTKGAYQFDFNPKSDAVTIFKIPISVLRRYPGVFKPEELLSHNNQKHLSLSGGQITGTISTPSLISETCHHFIQWNEFFKQNPHATKEQILSKAKSLEGKSERKVKTDLSLR